MFFHTLFSLKTFLPRGSNTKQSHLNFFIFYLHDSHIEKCFTNRNIFPLVWNQTTLYCQLFFYMSNWENKILLKEMFFTRLNTNSSRSLSRMFM